jgi:phage shock protein A
MKEGIAARVGRIISGSLNQLINTFENTAPEAVMDKAIDEVDGVIDDVRAELGKVTVDKHQATKRLTSASEQHADLTEKLELAVSENRDDLAEAAISRQLDLEAQIPVLQATITELGEKEKELEGYINALLAKKREMKEELRQFRQARAEASASTVTTDTGTTGSADVQSRLSRAESAFDRVMENQTHLPGNQTDVKTASQLAELEDLARKNRIQERLAAVKAKVKDKP